MNKVSILMPAFNEALFIREAVESVAVERRCNNLELIIVDDFSEDNTWHILQELKDEYDFLKIYKNNKKGKNSAFNLAYTYSSGNIIVLLAADDILSPGILKKRTEPLYELKDLTITLCKYKTFSTVKKLDSIIIPKDKDLGARGGGTMAFTRGFAESVFPIPEILANEDMWINCHIDYDEHINLIHIPEVGLLYRLHENNSLKRNVDFETTNKQVHERSIVYSVFLESYREDLCPKVIDSIARQACLEQLRWDGAFLSLLFVKKVCFRNKIRALVYSKKLPYSLYNYAYRFLAG